jgi:superfamily II DNA/RNA helicase
MNPPKPAPVSKQRGAAATKQAQVTATSTRKTAAKAAQPSPKPAAKQILKPAVKRPTKASVKPVSKAVPKAVSKPGAKPVAKSFAKSVVKPAAKPAVTTAAKVPARRVVQPLAKAKTVSKPAAKAGSKPAAKAVTKPVAKKPVAKKLVVKTVSKPVVKAPAKVPSKRVVANPVRPVAKPVASPVVAKRAVQAPAKGTAKTATRPVSRPAVKVAPKPVVSAKPAARPVPKPAAPVAAKPIAKPAVKQASKPVTTPTGSSNPFAKLGVPSNLVAALDAKGIASPFPIQTLTIPDGLAGRDVCGQAKTGSGKTLAFGIPLVALLSAKAAPRKPIALVLVPTRELAAQVEREMVWLAKPGGHSVVSIYGGVSMENQKDLLNKGAEIVVATPGRLIDLLGRGDIDLGSIQFLVLDEADRMCDMGFMPNVEWLLRKMPKQRQTLLFSATLGSDVNSLIRHELRDPVRHVVESTTSTVDSSVHHFFQVHQMDKSKVIASILRANDRGIVFLNTKRACDRIADELKDLGLVVRAIHGDLSQDQRNRALKQFTNGQIRALVATDVAARGLHIDGVDVVIQADLPDDHKTYLHRAGRTARAGATGVVVTLAVWNQLLDLERLQKRLGMAVKPVEVFSNDPRLATLADWAR